MLGTARVIPWRVKVWGKERPVVEGVLGAGQAAVIAAMGLRRHDPTWERPVEGC